MIPFSETPAVFYYACHPVTDTFRQFPGDGGFSVTLYQDNRLVVTLYRSDGFVRDQMTYIAPTTFQEGVWQLMPSASFVGGLPTELHLSGQRVCRFVSCIGLPGYPLITCEDIPQMIRQPLMDKDGNAARRLCVLFEDLCTVAHANGLMLDIDGYDIDPEKILPFQQPAEGEGRRMA